MDDFAVTTLTCVVMLVLTVVVHYEALRLISDHLMPRLRMHPRNQMIYVILAVFFAHTLEVWLFAGGYYVLVATGTGGIHGAMAGQGLDYVYFSLVSYTSLGFGDVYPSGGLRMLTGLEALIGLLMIGWSASFTYLSMEGLWRAHAERGARVVPRRHGH